MMVWLVGYGVVLLVVGVLDGAWLGYIARDFYRGQLGDQMVDSVRVLPAAMFYFGYPVGLVTLALTPLPSSLLEAVLRSALLGLVAYGVYDMTNMATLRFWSWKLALVDLTWGTLVAAVAGAAAWYAMQWMAQRG
jgi:uncharacterized membrane protein